MSSKPYFTEILIYMLLLSVFLIGATCQEINWVDCSEHVPTPDIFDSSAVDLRNLPPTLKCGQIVVPMDYSKALTSNNNITLGLAMYRPMQPKGVIFFCPGGSDAGVVNAWNAALNITSSFGPDFSGLLDYDLLLLDIRGTYSSNALNVSLDKVAPLFDSYPTSESEFESAKEAASAAIQSWVQLSSPPGIIGYVGTREVVEDFNQVRLALGYEQIHWLGGSYGTYRALQFAYKYPQAVGRFVLDAVAPHGVNNSQQAKDTIVAINRGLLRADAYCQNNSSCPVYGKGKGIIPGLYQDIISEASNSSFTTAWAVQSTISGLLQVEPDFPLINNLIYALSLNLSALNDLPQNELTVAGIVAYIIECGDSPIIKSYSEFQKSLEYGLKYDTYGLRQADAWLSDLACSAWPFDTAPLLPLYTEIPMLLITADFDNGSPTEWTTDARWHIPNSTLVVRHGDDHVSFNLPYLNTWTIEKDFLCTGIFPKGSNDSSITIYAPGTQRATVPDPYSVTTGYLAGDTDSAAE